MDHNFEKFGASSSEQFKTMLARKIEASLRHSLQKRLEQYLEEHIDESEITLGAEQVFSLLMKGESQEEIDREITALAERLSEEM